MVGLRGAGWLEQGELAVYDQFVRRAERQPTSVALVLITEDDLREQGHWPLSDRVLAEAILAVSAAGARAIGFDLYRDLPVSPGTEMFQRVLRDEPRLVAVRKFGDLAAEGIAGPPVLEGTDRVGFNDLLRDPDDSVRRALLFQDDGKSEVQTSFALRLALIALAEEGVTPAPDPQVPEWMRLGAATFEPLAGDAGGYVRADAAGYQYLLDFRATPFPRYRLGDLLRGKVDASRLRDRVVLIGAKVRSLPDLFSTPIGVLAGVEVHAHGVDQVLRAARGAVRPIGALAEWQELAAVGLLAVLGAALGLGVGRGSLGGAVAVVALALGGVAALWVAGLLAHRADRFAPVVAPALAWVSGVGLTNAWASGRERAQRAQLMRVFERSVSAEVAEEIWVHRDELFAEGRLRPRRVLATLLFVDMKGYTGRSEKMDPEQAMDWVNEFMQGMARQVEAHGGFVDDYFGDGLKADFGVPVPRRNQQEVVEDARNAVRCSLAMAQELSRVNERYRARGLPEVGMRVGIHSGPVVAGSLGSADRIKYTVVGDVVVTAQRLEATDAVPHDFDRTPCRILVSEATLRLAGGGFETEALGTIDLKGKQQGVAVHRLWGPLPGGEALHRQRPRARPDSEA